MLENITYKYRIYLTEDQKKTFTKISNAETNLINLVLQKIDRSKFNYPSVNDLFFYLGKVRKEGHADIFNDLYSSTIPLLIRRLAMGINICKKNNVPFPMPKNPKDYVSSIIFNPQIDRIQMVSRKKNRAILNIKKFGNIKLVFHRPFPKNSTCIATIIKKIPNDQFYIFFVLQGSFGKEKNYEYKSYDKTIGLDFSLKNFFVSTDPKIIPNMNLLTPNREELKLIKTRQNNLMRENKYSKNHERTHILYSKLVTKLKYRRIQEYYRLIDEILKKYDVIAVETLKMEKMKQNTRFSNRVLQLGYIEFLKLLTYKAELEGKHVVKISPWYPSSQICSVCEYKNNNLKIYDKTWICPKCHSFHVRDENAAFNIKKEGNRVYNLN